MVKVKYSMGEIVWVRDANGQRRKGRYIEYGQRNDGTGRWGHWVDVSGYGIVCVSRVRR